MEQASLKYKKQEQKEQNRANSSLYETDPMRVFKMYEKLTDKVCMAHKQDVSVSGCIVGCFQL